MDNDGGRESMGECWYCGNEVVVEVSALPVGFRLCGRCAAMLNRRLEPQGLAIDPRSGTLKRLGD